MKRLLVSLIAIGAASSSFGQPSPWVTVVTAENNVTYEFKTGSFELSKNGAGETIGAVISRTTMPDRSIRLNKKYVRTTECEAGQGKIVTLNLSGEFAYDNDFLFQGGTIASSLAEMLCVLLAMDRDERRKKSM